MPVQELSGKALRRNGDLAREKILDAGEKLFALQGFHGTSMRDIATEAGMGVALVTHHFQSKDLLLVRVVERRSIHLNAKRIEALDAARRAVSGRGVPVRDIAQAFVWPLLERWSHGGTGWKYYVELLAKLANSSRREVISSHFDAVARTYLDELEKTLAGHDRTGIYYGFNFMVGMMLTVVSQPDRVERLSFGNVTANDADVVCKMMVDFIDCGFRSIPGHHASAELPQGAQPARRSRARAADTGRAA